MSLLPLPISIQDVSKVLKIKSQSVRDIIKEMSPMIQLLDQRIIFRDEPTETVVYRKYGRDEKLRSLVLENLDNAQSTSEFAALIYPELLFSLDKYDTIRKLAFSEEYPDVMDYEFKINRIRYNRLQTALRVAAKSRDFSQLLKITIELILISRFEEQGRNFLISNPDLAIGFNYPDALNWLIESQTEWRGEYYTRLMTAYLINNQQNEASDNYIQAYDWHKWYFNQDSKSRLKIDLKPEELSAIALYFLSRDQLDKLMNVLNHWRAPHGYFVAKKFIEYSIVNKDSKIFGKFTNFINQLIYQKNLSPHLITAVFTVVPKYIEQKSELKLLEVIAKNAKSHREFVHSGFDGEGQDSYQNALIRSALRMCKHGLNENASQIMNIVNASKKYRTYTLKFQTLYYQIVPNILSVAIQSGCKGRNVNFSDCLPKELFELIENLSNLDDDRIVKEELGKRLENLRDSKERKESDLNDYEIYKSGDYLEYEIPFIYTLTQLVHGIIFAKNESELLESTLQYFREWTRVCTDNDEKFTNLIVLYEGCAVEMCASLDILTLEIENELINCLNSNPNLRPDSLINFVNYLSRNNETHEIGAEIAKIAMNFILKVESRLDQAKFFADLSRVYLEIDRERAKEIFEEGEHVFDAIGSEDLEDVRSLMKFAVTMQGAEVEPTLVHKYTKIVEANVHDPQKWEWGYTAKTLASISGMRSFTQITRWFDRDLVEMYRTLPYVLINLLENQKISASIAVSMLKLVDSNQVGDRIWVKLVNLIESDSNFEKLLTDVLNQYEILLSEKINDNRQSEFNQLLKSLLIDSHKLIDKEVSFRVERLIQKLETPIMYQKIDNIDTSDDELDIRLPKESESEENELKSTLEYALDNIDPLSRESFDKFASLLREYSVWYTQKEEVFQKIREKVKKNQRGKHIDVIISSHELSLYSKIELLNEIKVEWFDASTKLTSISPKIKSRIIEEHASELLTEKWGSTYRIENLSNALEIPKTEIVLKLLNSTIIGRTKIPLNVWFNFVIILSERTEEKRRVESFEKLLKSLSDKLIKKSGDEDWSNKFDYTGSTTEKFAGLIWFCLGSPNSSDRWYAGHCIRSLAKFGEWEIIENLVSKYKSLDAGTFQNQDQPFYYLNARFWLLLSIARIAIDFPQKIQSFKDVFVSILEDDSFPHVGFQMVACEALKNCFPSIKRRELKKIKGLISKCDPFIYIKELNVITKFFYNLMIDAINFYRRKTLKLQGYIARYRLRKIDLDLEELKRYESAVFDTATTTTSYSNEKSSEVEKESQSMLSFHLDWNKHLNYQIRKLADVFDKKEEEIIQMCIDYMLSCEPDIEKKCSTSGRNIFREKVDSVDVHQSYGIYLGWHALAVVAGKLYNSNKMIKKRAEDWNEWLSDYRITKPSEFWIADKTQPYPARSLKYLLTKPKKRREINAVSSDEKLLASLIGIEKANFDEIVVHGSWSSPDDVQVKINSALIDPEIEELYAKSVLTAPLYFKWLPHYSDNTETDANSREFEEENCTSWITLIPQNEHLDERDPLGSKSALSYIIPSSKIRKKFKLKSTSIYPHEWHNKKHKVAFRYEGWGGIEHKRDGDDFEWGSALYCNSNFLKDVLTKLNLKLIVLVTLKFYNSSSELGIDLKQDEEYSHSTLVRVIDKSLNVKKFDPTSEQIAVIQDLDENEAKSFKERFRALEQLKNQKSET